MVRRVSEYVLREAFVAGAEDAHGNPVEAWLQAVTVGVYGFDPGSTSEPREGQARVIVEPTLYMPDGVVFEHRDKVTVRGVTYDVEGVTREWRHPDGRRPGNVVSLRVAEG